MEFTAVTMTLIEHELAALNYESEFEIEVARAHAGTYLENELRALLEAYHTNDAASPIEASLSSRTILAHLESNNMSLLTHLVQRAVQCCAANTKRINQTALMKMGDDDKPDTQFDWDKSLLALLLRHFLSPSGATVIAIIVLTILLMFGYVKQDALLEILRAS